MQNNNFNLEYFINGQNDPSPEMAAAFKKISKSSHHHLWSTVRVRVSVCLHTLRCLTAMPSRHGTESMTANPCAMESAWVFLGVSGRVCVVGGWYWRGGRGGIVRGGGGKRARGSKKSSSSLKSPKASSGSRCRLTLAPFSWPCSASSILGSRSWPPMKNSTGSSKVSRFSQRVAIMDSYLNT